MTGLNNWKKIRELGFEDQFVRPAGTEEEESTYKKLKENYMREITDLQRKLLALEISRNQFK